MGRRGNGQVMHRKFREILSITGITIRETGTFGTGARFEMLVSEGAYGFLKNTKHQDI